MKEHGRKLKIWELAALCSLCIALCVGTWAQGRQNSISANLVRLHVVAVSDEQQEQELKLRVRDAVLDYLGPELEGISEPQEAKRIIGESLEGIENAAKSAAEGRQVTVSLGTERYPTRQYEGFTLPAGQYESLKVVLGEGKGHNWWCIVFPPICLSAVQSEPIESALGGEDFALVTQEDGYQLRLRLVELWGELAALIEGL